MPAVRLLLLFFPRIEFCSLVPVSARLHAAPAPFSRLGSIDKVQDTVLVLAGANAACRNRLQCMDHGSDGETPSRSMSVRMKQRNVRLQFGGIGGCGAEEE